jgi:hypothetical protein
MQDRLAWMKIDAAFGPDALERIERMHRLRARRARGRLAAAR